MTARRVLMVDDDDVNILSFGALLEEAGWEVVSATTIAEGRAKLAQGPFALAVLDVHVGKELGPSLAPEIRASSPGVVIAILSGSIREHERKSLSADLILAKADDPRMLLEALEKKLSH